MTESAQDTSNLFKDITQISQEVDDNKKLSAIDDPKQVTAAPLYSDDEDDAMSNDKVIMGNTMGDGTE